MNVSATHRNSIFILYQSNALQFKKVKKIQSYPQILQFELHIDTNSD